MKTAKSDFIRETSYKHGRLAYYVRRDERVVQFLVDMGWGILSKPERFLEWPRAIDLSYHSPKPMYEGHAPMEGVCSWMKSGVCYYDGSSLNAEQPLRMLKERGEEALWRYLENYWLEVFERGRADGFGQLVNSVFGD